MALGSEQPETGPRPSPGCVLLPTFSLIAHPDHPPLAVDCVTAEVIWAPDDLLITYQVLGAEKMLVPDWRVSRRVDELWRTTCFELFLMFDDGERYVEWNFSPSTEWATYSFEGYRDGMKAFSQDVEPFIERKANGVEVDCYTGDLPLGFHRMALTAVVEEEGGMKSYWALAHPPGAPDFHHPACFAARLPAPGEP